MAACAASGCVSPIALHTAVLAYDQTVTRVNNEELLLNIVRARHHRPTHFTTVSSVAATFDFRVSAGISPPEQTRLGIIGPVAVSTVAENPTITIVPFAGEEFTKRLLTPMDESRFLSLLRTGDNMHLMLRLMTAELRLEGGAGKQV